MSSPLGRYSEVIAAAVVLLVVVAGIAVMVGLAIPPDEATKTALLALVSGVVGVVIGQRATTNGAAKVAQAAHRRLDAINAPPADEVLGTTSSGA